MLVPGVVEYTAGYFAAILAVIQNAVMFFGFLEFVGR